MLETHGLLEGWPEYIFFCSGNETDMDLQSISLRVLNAQGLVFFLKIHKQILEQLNSANQENVFKKHINFVYESMYKKEVDLQNCELGCMGSMEKYEVFLSPLGQDFCSVCLPIEEATS